MEMEVYNSFSSHFHFKIHYRYVLSLLHQYAQAKWSEYSKINVPSIDDVTSKSVAVWMGCIQKHIYQISPEPINDSLN